MGSVTIFYKAVVAGIGRNIDRGAGHGHQLRQHKGIGIPFLIEAGSADELCPLVHGDWYIVRSIEHLAE